MKRIAVLTSGGDAPGMNAAIRAVVRVAIFNGLKVSGINRGYSGLLEGDIVDMDVASVGDIIHRGGTKLRSARCKKFMKPEGVARAAEVLKVFGIDGLIIIGGDGSFRGAQKLCELGIPTIGIPATIDNDLGYTDYTIGFFTAMQTVVDSIDKLRDTSMSHNRCSVVEVMGRNCGDLALYAGIAGGSEFIITPETGFDKELLIDAITKSNKSGKKHAIVIVTENMLNVVDLTIEIEKRTGFETRATVLGHVQRGGDPAAFDRVLATEMGEYAVDLLVNGQSGRAVGLKGMEYVDYDINFALNKKREIPNKRYGLVGRLK